MFTKLDLDPTNNIFFIQMGSNDGVSGDPIYKDAKKYGWSGVVIEPEPSRYEILVNNYKYNPNVIPLNLAISTKTGMAPFYVPDNEKNAQSSLIKPHLIKHNINKPREINVTVWTIKDLWDHIHPSKVDILHMDIEGFEPTLLLDTNFDKISPKPKSILYEHLHIPKDTQQTILSHLNKYGYTLKDKFKQDTLVSID